MKVEPSTDKNANIPSKGMMRLVPFTANPLTTVNASANHKS